MPSVIEPIAKDTAQTNGNAQRCCELALELSLSKICIPTIMTSTSIKDRADHLHAAVTAIEQVLLAKEAEVAERTEALASRKAEMAARSTQVRTISVICAWQAVCWNAVR
eukprot:5560-Heterococcus_DN1.PRE.5